MLTRLRRGLRELGWIGLLYRVAADACARVGIRFVWYVLIAQPVSIDRRIPVRLGSSVEIRRLEKIDVLLEQSPRPQEVLTARFGQGSVCFAAVTDGRLLGFLWLCPGRYDEDEVRCTFALPASGEAWWDYDVWVQPGFRNGIVFAKLWQAAHAYLQSMRARWTLSRIARNNRVSLSSHQRLGATAIGNAWFIDVRQWQFMISSHSPRFSLSRSAIESPVLHLEPPHDPPLAMPAASDSRGSAP